MNSLKPLFRHKLQHQGIYLGDIFSVDIDLEHLGRVATELTILNFIKVKLE
jgi:hypothetical protein